MPALFFNLDWGDTALLVSALAFLFSTSALLFPRPLETREARKGIMSLELAWRPSKAGMILESWGRNRILARAKRNVQWDFVFIPCYATFAAVVGVIAARGAAEAGLLSDATAKDLATAVAWTMLCAGLLDVGENLALFRVFRAQRGKDPSAAAVAVASTFATVKLFLLGGGLLLSIGLAVGALAAWLT
jgi:hypothetical protein